MRAGDMIHRARPLLAAAALAAAAPQAAQAKIDLVTLPARDVTELTIYKAEDLTLVRETRTLTFDEGLNEIQFSWANTLIDPTSLQIRFVNPSAGTEILDARYPAGTQNTIVWNITAEEEKTAAIEIAYFASGLNWRADYTAVANPDETELRLEPNFTLFNNSGEDFHNARTRLVVGEINLEEAIAELARRGIVPERAREELRRGVAEQMMLQSEADPFMTGSLAAPRAAAADVAFAKEIVKKAVSEYQLYTIEGEETLETGWGKQLPDPAVPGIPIDVSYEYDPQKYGNQVVKFYKFENVEEDELGDQPLPSGTWYVSSQDGRGGLRFQGSTNNKYVPVGEDIELNLGSDGLVILESRVMDVDRTAFRYDRYNNIIGHDDVEVLEFEIRNSNTRAVPFKMRQYFNGDWEITETSDDFKKVDRNTVEWEFDVPALDKKIVRITRVTARGANATAN